ncbi:hypothetical protein WAI05_22340, partial [Acinetobacter baumannii]
NPKIKYEIHKPFITISTNPKANERRSPPLNGNGLVTLRFTGFSITPKFAQVGKRFSTFFTVPVNPYFSDKMKHPISKYTIDEK